MKLMNRIFLSCFSVFGLAVHAVAHEGHGTPGEGHTAKHYLLEPVHVPLMIVIIVTAIVAAAVLLRYAKHRQHAHRS